MWKSIYAAAFVVTLGMGMAASAEDATGGSGPPENSRLLSLKGDERKQTITCEPDTEVTIEGTSNEYRIRGDCKRISVNGTSNTVRVGSPGRLTVGGTGNVVVYDLGDNGPSATSASRRKP